MRSCARMCVCVSLRLSSDDRCFVESAPWNLEWNLPVAQQEVCWLLGTIPVITRQFTFTSFKLHWLYIQIHPGHPAAANITTDFSISVRLINRRLKQGFLLKTMSSAETKLYERAVHDIVSEGKLFLFIFLPNLLFVFPKGI